MSSTLTELEQSSVADRVRRALAKYQPRTYQIAVNDATIVKDEDWYHVLVTTPNHQRDRDFYDALAKTERDLEADDRGDVHYLLVPVLG